MISIYEIFRAKILFAFFAIAVSLNCHASEIRDLLQKQATISELKKILLDKKDWIKYPQYNDRNGWDNLTGANKTMLISGAVEMLGYEWKLIKAIDYLEFERSGSRQIMENPYYGNNVALLKLIFGELAEGKGRFMDQIINGIWYTCEMSSWSSSAHLISQKSGRTLPDFNEKIIDLVSGDVAAFLSWTWHFLHKEFDKINPIISAKLRLNIKQRILEPYLQKSDYWWQGFTRQENYTINNWNPWCNSNVLNCFLLIEENRDTLAEAVYKTMQSVDKFINHYHDDGACEEGPSYWGHAAGKLYDYLQLLSNATNNKVNIFNHPLLKNMGEYIANSYVGNGWVVNFADASAKGGGDPGLIFRFGKAINSNAMQGFASYLVQNLNGKKLHRTL